MLAPRSPINRAGGPTRRANARVAPSPSPSLPPSDSAAKENAGADATSATTFLINVAADLASFEKSKTNSKFDKAMKGLGILGWAVAYCFIVYVNYARGTSLIRRDLVAYNLTWEVLRTFLWNDNDSGWLTTVFGLGWLGLDLFIVHALLKYGDGTPGVSLDQQRLEFAGWCAFYTAISMMAHRAGPAVARVWRHASYLWSTAAVWYILRHTVQWKTDDPYLTHIAWSTFIGNAVYLYSCWGLYDGWFRAYTHPVRFAMVVFVFVPTHLFNVYFCAAAHTGETWGLV